MAIWAISDLHLCFGTPSKTMEVFGQIWKDYSQKIYDNWKNKINSDDLVLICGDISWGKTLDEAKADFLWLEKLPGTKIIIKGNHDYWWPSKTKLKEFLPSSFRFIQLDAFEYENISITGTRLWDNPDVNFDEYINFQKNLFAGEPKDIDDDKIFQRELERLKMCLAKLNPKSKLKIVMTHFPPISADLKSNIVSTLLEKNNVDICVFGHLHQINKEKKLFGEKNKVKYILTSADYLDFEPIQIY